MKNKIRDTGARVYLIGECGGERSCHGLLTGVRYAHTPSTAATFAATLPPPPTYAPLPAVIRSAAAGR